MLCVSEKNTPAHAICGLLVRKQTNRRDAIRTPDVIWACCRTNTTGSQGKGNCKNTSQIRITAGLLSLNIYAETPYVFSGDPVRHLNEGKDVIRCRKDLEVNAGLYNSASILNSLVSGINARIVLRKVNERTTWDAGWKEWLSVGWISGLLEMEQSTYLLFLFLSQHKARSMRFLKIVHSAS
jgi:hypothetical protein